MITALIVYLTIGTALSAWATHGHLQTGMLFRDIGWASLFTVFLWPIPLAVAVWHRLCGRD